jgi:hypothetical protein
MLRLQAALHEAAPIEGGIFGVALEKFVLWAAKWT